MVFSLKLGSNRGVAALKMTTTEKVKYIWRSTDCVCFDVDSTIIEDEGIDELAAYLGVKEEVERLTAEAMTGEMTFKESLEKRMNIIRPHEDQVQQLIDENPLKLTPHFRELVEILQKRNIPVYLISGGFDTIIEPVAKQVNIDKDRIFANKLKFTEDGNYDGFDESVPTCESGGKTKVVQLLKQKYGYKNLVHIGDGVTDMEAFPPADAFIGFGGNQVREQVRKSAKWFVTSFKDLIDEIHNSVIY